MLFTIWGLLIVLLSVVSFGLVCVCCLDSLVILCLRVFCCVVYFGWLGDLLRLGGWVG